MQRGMSRVSVSRAACGQGRVEWLKMTDDRATAAIVTLAEAMNEPTTPPKAMTVAEAPRALGVSVATIYAQVQQGKLPCERIGQGWGTIGIRPIDPEERQQGEKPRGLEYC
jgi:excisionase family DNA binding protein